MMRQRRKFFRHPLSGVTLAEMVVVAGLFMGISAAMFVTMTTVRNIFFINSTRMDLKQQGRFAIEKMSRELIYTSSGKAHIYKCPPDYCQGGVVTFQVPVINNAKVAGSIYKDSANPTIKWGYDGVETNEEIVYMVPGPTSQFVNYQNQLVRITRKPYCQDGFCNASEDTDTCPEDCHCNDGICDVTESTSSCPEDCFCGNILCDSGEDNAACENDCYCGNGTCDAGEDSVSCGPDCDVIGFYEEAPFLWFPGDAVAFAAEKPVPPDISDYVEFDPLPGGVANYSVSILSNDIQAAFFTGIPGPGTGGEAPRTIAIYLSASKPILFGGDIDVVATSKIGLRNLGY